MTDLPERAPTPAPPLGVDWWMQVLCYAGPLALIPLSQRRRSVSLQWQARQGLVLGVGGVIACAIVLYIVPILGCIAWPALVGVDVYALVCALRGEPWRIPGVADVSERL